MVYILIFNINTTIPEVIEHLSNIHNKYTKIVFVTSHSLFQNEESELKEANQVSIDFLNFGSFNSTKDLLNIDLKAYNKSKHRIDSHSLYINTFKRHLLFEKNQFIHNHIKSIYPNAEYFVFCKKFDPNNLGLSYLFWKSKAKIINSDSLYKNGRSNIRNLLNYGTLGQIFYFGKAIYFALKPRTFNSIHYDNSNWVFPSLYRINLATDRVSSKLATPLGLSLNKKNTLSIGLHESGKLLNAHPIIQKNKVHVIGDAYRPSNYPPYLFALLFTGVKYIPKYHTDYTFFKNSGIEVVDPKPGFLKKDDLFKNIIELKNRKVQTIVLSINHTGDWTALLSRSDTDVLIRSFANISKNFNSTNFIIRLHPTMDSIKAEGKSSKQRIRKFIEELNYSNLSVSSASMEEDWERGDVFISEYSLSVIDAINKGKIGIFYNLTDRISFVDDLLDKGINYFTKEKDVIAKLEKLISQ